MTFYATINDGKTAFTVNAKDRDEAVRLVRARLTRREDAEALPHLIVLTASEWNHIGVVAKDAAEFRYLVMRLRGLEGGRSPWARNGHQESA